jgi:hypothetical protein
MMGAATKQAGGFFLKQTGKLSTIRIKVTTYSPEYQNDDSIQA